MEQARSFDRIAGLYRQARRGYPAALFDDLAERAGLGPDCQVLEVGCGTGQATVDLAARAHSVLAIDPGAQLIAEARAQTQGVPNIDYTVSRFEDLAPAKAGFDLVTSAQAWHWVDPAIGFPKAADALRPGGSFAIFGHVPMTLPEPFNSAFRTIVDHYWPGVWGSPPSQAAYLPTGPFAAMIRDSGLFGPVTHRAYAWTWSLDPDLFGRYMRTDSSYHALEESSASPCSTPWRRRSPTTAASSTPPGKPTSTSPAKPDAGDLWEPNGILEHIFLIIFLMRIMHAVAWLGPSA
jgi:SAM-dependent methyltransferase